MERNYLSTLRSEIESQYLENPTGCGGSFGEILCYELHRGGLTFVRISLKWGISLPMLGELIWDHCKRLEPLPKVNHEFET